MIFWLKVLMNKKLCIIDYGINNIHSVGKALLRARINFEIINNANKLNDFTHVILPGVGSFDVGIKKLKERNFYSFLKKNDNLKIFGICLGMQLLFDSSEESFFGEKGLSLIEGKVLKMKSYKKQNINIPQIGWNELVKVNESELMNELNQQSFYFVNSYYVDPIDKNLIKFNYLHGKHYPAIIKKNNIFATQFHPEKSDNGLSIFKYFYDN
jgi:glutamine amidotransferase